MRKRTYIVRRLEVNANAEIYVDVCGYTTYTNCMQIRKVAAD